jgi:Mannosylglycerate hydrolase MGH1-like glycoside hydrolase domain
VPNQRSSLSITAEGMRLAAIGQGMPWRRWGPYLSERQWGTVREDYSAAGDAWNFFPHDHARSRAYRWGEDGIAGFADEDLLLCLGLALWNGKDPILKERLFGLTNAEGNHGEDVKELYYYVDGTPTHSYMRMLYKYPQAAFPYDWLVEENRRRGWGEPEFELIDTGVFADNRYFDVEIEYAKAEPEDLLMQVTVFNRAREPALLHVLPQIWARNIWSWQPDSMRPRLVARGDGISIDHPQFSPLRLMAEGVPEFLFCENETNAKRLWGAAGSGTYFKDGINDYVVGGDRRAVNPARIGTKAGAHYRMALPAGGSQRLRLRLTGGGTDDGFGDFDTILNARRAEADEFHTALERGIDDPEMRRVHRQAIAGMLWTKQYYHFDIPKWLDGDALQPPPPEARKHGRNADWRHLNNADIISVPDKWEYPWYAAWDLAFHALVLAAVDPQYAKHQLLLLTRDWYMHPNGQLPAYEWSFGDVNPPVHAWATFRVYEIDRDAQGGRGDRAFLERVFHRLMLNFTWWVNRKDVEGRNIFQGGFLGLDNIGIFDRSAPLPTGGTINQSDGTAWMAMYTLNLMRIALELALEDAVYEDIAAKFFEHFLYIAEAMTNIGGDGIGLWDETDEFYYDVLHLPDGERIPLRLRSMVGLIPLFAVEVLDSSIFARLPEFKARALWFLDNRPQLARLVSRWHDPGSGEKHLLSLLRGHRMKRLLSRMLDPAEFLSDYGVRSLSRFYKDHPYVFEHAGNRISVEYVAGNCRSAIFGGNSNWRGPVWFPVNYLLIEALHRFHSYYGDDFRVECPVGSGNLLHLGEVATELAGRLCRLFLPDAAGHRPIFGPAGTSPKHQPFRDELLFYEFFDGDTGQGLGAEHQTGWTALVAPLLKMCAGTLAMRRTAETSPPIAAAAGK